MLSHLQAFMASLHKMQENEVMTDVTLNLPDESTISCHKLVLMAASPFFESMFQSGLKESNERDVQLEFSDAGTIRMLVEFFYSGEIDVNEKNVQAVVLASEFLCMNDLKTHCDKYMATLVDVSNCIELSRFGKTVTLNNLVSGAQECILSNFGEVAKKSSDFKTLTDTELAEVISNDGLYEKNEDIVFEAVVSWVKVDLGGRRDAFSRIAPLIRFSFCTDNYLTHVVCLEPLMLTRGCMDFLREAKQYNANSHHYLHNARTVPRSAFIGKRQKLVRMHQEGYSCLRFEYTQCIEGDIKWRHIDCSFSDLTSADLVTYDTIIFCINRGTCSQCHSLDILNERKRSSIEWKPPKCKNCTFIFLNGKMYAFGGTSENGQGTKKVESFDIYGIDPQWQSEASMLQEVEAPYVVKFTNKVYVFGGTTDSGSSQVTQEFDPVWVEWKTRSAMPGVCTSGATVALNDKIFVVGGRERVCFSFEPLTDTWTVLTQPNNAYRKCSATVWGNRILLVGTEFAEEYDFEDDCWSDKAALVPLIYYCDSRIFVSTFLF